ncbi:methyltransferase domain-containing protein [Cellulomonas sp. URHB0016]
MRHPHVVAGEDDMADERPEAGAYRFSREVALRHALLYDRDYQSPLEQEVFDSLVARVPLPPRADVLDVGSGLGGDAFSLAARHGAHVVALDASEDLTELARERQYVDAPGTDVDLVCGNVLTSPAVRPGAFDVVWTRDCGAFLTPAQKRIAWRRLHAALRPGGAVLATDHCLGTSTASADLGAWMRERGQHLTTVSAYAELLTRCGFVDVVTADRTVDLVAAQEHGLEVLEERRDELRTLGSDEEYAALLEQWTATLERARSGELVWMVLTARR